jgi:hypothetical protein
LANFSHTTWTLPPITVLDPGTVDAALDWVNAVASPSAARKPGNV